MKKLLLIISCVFLAGTAVLADPLDGQTLKFQQLPMDGTVIGDRLYWGHDELSTAVRVIPNGDALVNGDPNDVGGLYRGVFMADDFADPFATPVVHVKWWGSYLNQPTFNGVGGVTKFLISFESDVPGGVAHPVDRSVTDFSRPGLPILNQIVTLGPLAPKSGTFTETAISPGGSPLFETLFEYNAELTCPFEQEPDTVYWLKIVALVDVYEPVPDDGVDQITLPLEIAPIQWGWHNRDYTIMDPFASVSPAVVPGEFASPGFPLDDSPIWHFQDDAVTGELDVTDFGVLCQIDVQQDPAQRPTIYLNEADGPGPLVGTDWGGIANHSKDLAFELYTPEPTTMILLALGGLGIIRRKGR